VLVGVVLGGAVTAIGAAAGWLVGGPTGAVAGAALSLPLAVVLGRVVGSCRPYPPGASGVALCLVDATWGALNTWASALFATVQVLRGTSVDASRSRGTGVVFLTDQAISGYATTVGNVVAGCSPRLEPHERIHVLQARLLGPAYLPLVGVGFVVATVLPYWLLVPGPRRRPVRGVGEYFTRGVYPHTWHEWWAYRVGGPA
jgi:hypothetical protein